MCFFFILFHPLGVCSRVYLYGGICVRFTWLLLLLFCTTFGLTFRILPVCAGSRNRLSCSIIMGPNFCHAIAIASSQENVR